MNPDLLGQQLLSSPCQSLNCTYFHSSVLRGSRKQEMRDCKGIKIFLAICPSSCRGKDFLPQSEVSWNLRLSHMSFLLGLLESETDPHELSAEIVFAVPLSSTLGFLSHHLCWVFFTFSFHRRRFHWVGLLLCLASTSWRPSLGCFSQVKSESQHQRCWGSV